MKRIFKLIAIFLLACSFTIAISINLLPVKLVAQSPQGINLIQQGIELYQAEQFERALQVWNTALTQEKDRLGKSLILSNLSLAYQNLGRWQEAETSINKSLEILNNFELKTQTYTEILAKALNSQGYLHWLKGNFSQAIATWDLAAKNYLEAGDTASVIKCKLNQTKALQAAGLSSKAQETLKQIDRELKQTSNSKLKITGLQYLGNVLRHVGNLEKSEQVLQESLNIAESPDTLLELGNTERALSNSYLATDRPQLADKYARSAIAHYQQAFNSGNKLKAGLNQLSLAIAMGKWSDIATLIPQINQSLDRLPVSRAGIYARLNFARSLSCLKEIVDNNNLACVSKVRRDQLKQLLARQKPDIVTPDWEQIAKAIEMIIQQAPDSKTKSYGIGELGKLYESQQKWQLAQNYTQQALLTLEGIQAPEIRYRWEWQLGRILKQQGNIKEAIATYNSALQNLKSVRSDLLIVNSEVQFSFRDNTEPLYREFVNLLLQRDRVGGVSQEHLEQAIQSIDTLQLAEVENFLNCDLSSILQFEQNTKNIDKLDSDTGFIYPIILEDRLEVIFKLPGQPLKHQANLVQKAKVEETLRELKTAIIRGYATRAIAQSQIVYNWLIAPWERDLETSDRLSTLVFVLDGELRNIPMGVLYDSKRKEYLVQKQYALALLPSFQTFDLETTATEFKVLGAGISEELQVENKSFIGLNITEELANIQNRISSSILLNSEFTQPNIQQNLDTGDFSVVHLATHGNFSSNPEETYIVVYDSDAAN
ncbi:MAG: tetratricopeptide repeat protein, partial [Pleurocapsa sp. MO_226.B13]|nr:tetratricopeptide repeat protein [Pleurocapsa sp. MO_226.B13]